MPTPLDFEIIDGDFVNGGKIKFNRAVKYLPVQMSISPQGLLTLTLAGVAALTCDLAEQFPTRLDVFNQLMPGEASQTKLGTVMLADPTIADDLRSDNKVLSAAAVRAVFDNQILQVANGAKDGDSVKLKYDAAEGRWYLVNVVTNPDDELSAENVNKRVLLGVGSSLAQGQGATVVNGQLNGYLKQLITRASGFTLINESIGGTTTNDWLTRDANDVSLLERMLIKHRPEIVYVGLGLGNAFTNPSVPNSNDFPAVAFNFLKDMQNIIALIQRYKARAIIGAGFPRDTFTAVQYEIVKHTNLALDTFPVPVVGLGRLYDNDLGGFIAGASFDGLHLEDPMYGELSYCFPQAYLLPNQVNFPLRMDRSEANSGIRITAAVDQPIIYDLRNVARSVTIGFDFRVFPGSVLDSRYIMSIDAFHANLRIRSNQGRIEVAYDGAQRETVAITPDAVMNAQWRHVTVTMNHVTRLVELYVDGLLIGSRLVPADMVFNYMSLGGVVANNAATSGVGYEYRNFTCHLCPLYPEQVRLLAGGTRIPQASLNLYSPMHEKKVKFGWRLINEAGWRSALIATYNGGETGIEAAEKGKPTFNTAFKFGEITAGGGFYQELPLTIGIPSPNNLITAVIPGTLPSWLKYIAPSGGAVGFIRNEGIIPGNATDISIDLTVTQTNGETEKKSFPVGVFTGEVYLAVRFEPGIGFRLWIGANNSSNAPTINTHAYPAGWSDTGLKTAEIFGSGVLFGKDMPYRYTGYGVGPNGTYVFKVLHFGRTLYGSFNKTDLFAERLVALSIAPPVAGVGITNIVVDQAKLQQKMVNARIIASGPVEVQLTRTGWASTWLPATLVGPSGGSNEYSFTGTQVHPNDTTYVLTARLLSDTSITYSTPAFTIADPVAAVQKVNRFAYRFFRNQSQGSSRTEFFATAETASDLEFNMQATYNGQILTNYAGFTTFNKGSYGTNGIYNRYSGQINFGVGTQVSVQVREIGKTAIIFSFDLPTNPDRDVALQEVYPVPGGGGATTTAWEYDN